MDRVDWNDELVLVVRSRIAGFSQRVDLTLTSQQVLDSGAAVLFDAPRRAF